MPAPWSSVVTAPPFGRRGAASARDGPDRRRRRAPCRSVVVL